MFVGPWSYTHLRVCIAPAYISHRKHQGFTWIAHSTAMKTAYGKRP